MLYFVRLLFFSINTDQETVLNWFGIETSSNLETNQSITDGYDFTISNFRPSPDLSLETFRLILKGLWEKILEGLTLGDIENVLFLILFLRFIILTIRYNLKTSFYMTCIGIFAGYLWYRHLIDLISMYRSVLLKLPFVHKLGIEAIELESLASQMLGTDLKLGENVHWYNPGQIIYYAFTKGAVNVDPETGLRYYIDPLSMLVSKLHESNKSVLTTLYYDLYNKVIPKIYDISSKFWTQLSGIAAYALITRIGKRYCPYLVRWHWTFLLIIGLVEQIFVSFIYRVYYFQTFVLIPQIIIYNNYIDPNLILEVNTLNGIIACLVIFHVGLTLFGLFHAICGQYFYIPFFVENTELHVGLRPKNSVYSGGYTAWQDAEEKEKNLKRIFPKFWYGWFGRGYKNRFQFVTSCKNLFRKFFNKIKKQFKF